jgi:hypothetical protein
MEEMRIAYNTLLGKHARKRPVGRLRRKLENNIIMDLREFGWEYVDWIHLALNRGQCGPL